MIHKNAKSMMVCKPVGNYRLTSQSNHYLYAVELSLVDALSISI